MILMKKLNEDNYRGEKNGDEDNNGNDKDVNEDTDNDNYRNDNDYELTMSDKASR